MTRIGHDGLLRRRKVNDGWRPKVQSTERRMREALKKRTGSRRDLEKSIDPKMPVVEAVDRVLTGLKTAGFGPEPGSPELRQAQRGVLTLLRTVRRLNRMPFWESLTIPRAPKSWVPKTKGGGATREDILSALDALHEVVANMNAIFATGRVVEMDEPEESWALDRYACGALLPTLVEQLNNFWVQLRTATDHQGPHV